MVREHSQCAPSQTRPVVSKRECSRNFPAGPLATELGQLLQLQVLRLDENEFSGTWTIPAHCQPDTDTTRRVRLLPECSCVPVFPECSVSWSVPGLFPSHSMGLPHKIPLVLHIFPAHSPECSPPVPRTLPALSQHSPSIPHLVQSTLS